MSRFWCLIACLERAADSFDLNEPTMIRAWLDTKQIGLIERYLLLGSQFLSKIYPSDQTIDLLEEYGEDELAARLREKSLTGPEPHISSAIHDFEFEEHIRNIACNKNPGEIIASTKRRIEIYRTDSNRQPVGVGATSIETYSRIAAERCLKAEEFQKVEEWLRREDSELNDTYKFDLWLRLGLARGDLASCEKERVATAISQTTQLELLIEVAKRGICLDAITDRSDDFYEPHLLKPDLESWEVDRYECGKHVFCYYQQVWLAKKLGIADRLEKLKFGASSLRLRRSRLFLEFVHDVACFEAGDLDDWKSPIRSLVKSLNKINIGKWDTGFTDLDVCTAASNNLGIYLEPLIRKACHKHDPTELERMLREELVPALRSRFLYDATIFGICDQLLLAKTCEPLSQELLAMLEKRNDESHEFKSGGYLSLARRYKELDDAESAKRVVRKGIAACFSYEYRKDTTINHFIDAFDAVIPYLSDSELERTVKFITQVLILLDELTDMAMLHDAPTYLVVFLAKQGYEEMAVEVTEKIQTKCRSMRCEPIAQAAYEEDLDIDSLSARLIHRMPDIEIGTVDPEVTEPRAYFVMSTTEYETISEMCDKLEAKIADSGYCSAFWNHNGIIRTLINCGHTKDALAVFREFRRAIQALVSPYPLL